MSDRELRAKGYELWGRINAWLVSPLDGAGIVGRDLGIKLRQVVREMRSRNLEIPWWGTHCE